jgi:hypothetical protein
MLNGLLASRRVVEEVNSLLFSIFDYFFTNQGVILLSTGDNTLGFWV